MKNIIFLTISILWASLSLAAEAPVSLATEAPAFAGPMGVYVGTLAVSGEPCELHIRGLDKTGGPGQSVKLSVTVSSMRWVRVMDIAFLTRQVDRRLAFHPTILSGYRGNPTKRAELIRLDLDPDHKPMSFHYINNMDPDIIDGSLPMVNQVCTDLKYSHDPLKKKITP